MKAPSNASAALHGLLDRMLDACGAVTGNQSGDHPIHCMRDPTRVGVATALNEIASQSKVGMLLHEDRIPVRETVQGACEIL